MASEAQTWDPEPLPMRLLTGLLLPLFSGCPVTFPLGVAAMDSCLHSDPPGTRLESGSVCSRQSQKGRASRTEEALEKAGGTGSRPLALYKGVRMIVKRYIMNDVTALEDFVNLFRNVKSFHFTTLVNC